MKQVKGRRGKGRSRAARAKPTTRAAPARPSVAKPYEFLEHMADVGFLARGKTLEALFASAALAMCDYGWDLDTVKAREAVEIRARAATLEDLLYSWLSEVLFLADAERWVFKKFSVEAVTQPGSELWEVRATARGEHFSKRRHRARTYIKAVTYHQLAVQQTPQGWQATAYLDV